MKRFGLLMALFTALPLAATAQFAVFTDNFTNGSTTNGPSVPGGTPAASFTSYDIASTKVTTNTPINGGRLRLGLNGATTSGFLEAQALFTRTPVALNTPGDFITLTYTFTNTSGSVIAGGTASFLYQGLYNSGGQPPVSGGALVNNLTTTSGSQYATNNAAVWQGYVERISNGGTSAAYTRPVQNGAGTTSANQDLVNNGSGSGSFGNPSATTIDATETTPVVLTSGAVYTESFTIALADANSLVITNLLYSGPDTTGALVFSQTNVASTTNNTFLTNSFDGLAIGLRNSGTSVNPTMDITSIKVTENIFGLPGPSFGVTGGGTGCPGDSFPVGLTGSVTTNDYRVFTNGVFNGVVHSGTGAAFNFTPETVTTDLLTNTVQASNTVSGFTGFMSGQVVVGPFGAPVITTQPQPVFTVNNNVGVFSVVSSGSGLGYQWFKNGTKLTDGGEFRGTTTANLVISPATAADAANYFVIVTNGCGTSVTSTTNALTLHAAGNISWQGGNPNNVWDLATTANFTNGAGPVVFNNGDNVTIDDTSAFPGIIIGSPFLAPSLITENGSQTFSFSGSGSITGPGALLMTGFGTLAISNANTFSGGTTISNGTIIAGNATLSAFGTGPVKLAGGILDLPIGGSAAIGLSNTVNTVTDSTLKFDGNGTFSVVLSGQLTGTPGATLTINSPDGNSRSDRMRLYGNFTNNANVVLSSAGSTIEMANYAPSGFQVFNGIISGNGGRFVPRTAGVTVFNNTNTFNDSGTFQNNGWSVLLSSGFIGIGADSVSSTPPTIDASPVGTGILAINTGTEGGTCGIIGVNGPHTIANRLIYTSATNTVTTVFGGDQNLTFSGEFDLANASGDIAGTNRTLQVTNTAATTFSGLITDNGLTSGIIKIGNGTLYITGQATNSGTTLVTAGVLAGTGTISNPVDVETNGAIGGGSPSAIGTLNIGNSLTLNANGFFRLNKSLSPAQSNDMVSVTGALSGSGTGTITVSNLGPAIAVGDKFKLFNKAVTGAGGLAVSGAGMNWQNNLAVDGSITALSVNTGPATNPTNIVFSRTGTNLSFSWPADHLGWFLQAKTNSLAVTNGWFDVPGSSTTTNVVLPIDPSVPMEFFRMSLQP